jgi:hypothetical protein
LKNRIGQSLFKPLDFFHTRRLPLAAVAACVGWLAISGAAQAVEAFRLFLPVCASEFESSFSLSAANAEAAALCIPRELSAPSFSDLQSPVSGQTGATVPKVSLPSSTTRPVHGFRDPRTAALFFGSSFLVVPLAGNWAWWKGDFDRSFHFANERWFQRDTYAGGADKASHFVMGTFGGNLFDAVYQEIGHTAPDAHRFAVANVLLAALIVEIGDGHTMDGFSWEDATASTLGGLLSVWINARGWHDTVGFRVGPVDDRPPSEYVPPGSVTPPSSALGSQVSYSTQIFSADLKLVGLLPRLHRDPRIARFLLLSMTYGSKGYQYTEPSVQQRNLGFYLGLNLRETLAALGVPENSWWGAPLLLLAEYVRLPYTSVGYQIDLNSRRWQFDAGHR